MTDDTPKNLGDVCKAAGIVIPDGHGCIERPPIEVVGSQALVTPNQQGDGVTPLETSRDCKLREALSVFTGNEWTLVLTSLSFTTTDGIDYETSRRLVELSLVTGSGKVADFRPASTDIGKIRKWVLVRRTLGHLFIGFTPGLVVPRDPAGPLLRRLYWSVSRSAIGGDFDWVVSAGLAWQAGIAR